MQLRLSGAATMTIGVVVPGCCVVQWVRSLVLCQDLAGSWYAQRECGGYGCKGSVVQWFCGLEESIVAQERQKLRGNHLDCK